MTFYVGARETVKAREARQSAINSAINAATVANSIAQIRAMRRLEDEPEPDVLEGETGDSSVRFSLTPLAQTYAFVCAFIRLLRLMPYDGRIVEL